MATPLVRPLSREILVGGAAYKVTLAADRLLLTPKGHRKGIELTWDELLSSRNTAESERPEPARPRSEVPRQVLTEIAKDLRAASASLMRADETLTQAGAMPAELMAKLSPDPVHGLAEQRDDWFVEPLLTIREVASILRVSTRAVRQLPLRTIHIGTEERFRQSDIRELLRTRTSRHR